MWIRTEAGVDYIFVHENTSRVHQDHIIAHEIGHIIRGHGLTGGPAGAPGEDRLDRLVPHLDPAKVRVMLGRTDYVHEEEREAELIGTHLQYLLHRPVRRRAPRQDRAARTLLRGWR
ncbi:secondary metabolite protein [Streptomyces vinaceus]